MPPMSSVLVDGVEQVVDLLRGSGGDEFVDLVGVGEDHRDLAQDFQVPIVQAGYADREPDLVAVPIDRILLSDDGQCGSLDESLASLVPCGMARKLPM